LQHLAAWVVNKTATIFPAVPHGIVMQKRVGKNRNF